MNDLRKVAQVSTDTKSAIGGTRMSEEDVRAQRHQQWPRGTGCPRRESSANRRRRRSP